jgi:DNA topoisomerase-1
MYKRKGYAKKKQSSDTTSTTKSTATYLVIVESPSKCAKIEEYLGKEYQCIASKGHLRTIEGMKSIQTKHQYQITFSIIDEKKNHIQWMQSIISQYSPEQILLATDDDREGEAIAWHICDLFQLPLTTPRIVFHEITQRALTDAVGTPSVINLSLVYAQQARQVLDMIVGYKISPFLWRYIHNNKGNGLSAGRCQTPALRLVYDNAMMEKRKEKNIHYKTTAYFFPRLIPFTLSRNMETESHMMDFLEISKTHVSILSLSPAKETYQSPPKPFTTSKLLQTASSVLHCSPKMTMDICQKLYQAGWITYMRTDSMKYSSVFVRQCREFIQSEFGSDVYIGDTDSLENKHVSNPHEAIRVTKLSTKHIGDDNKTVCAMYRLIWRNTVESCMASAKYKTTIASITAPENETYTHKIDVPVFLGWRKVAEKSSQEDDTVDTQTQTGGLLMYLQSILSSKSAITLQYIDSQVAVQHRHTHYTEASLIQTLEDLGIGRPSTFASLVDTIQERGYVQKTNVQGEVVQCVDFKLRAGNPFVLERTVKERVFGAEKNKLVIQPTGILTLEFLLEHFQSLFSYDYTKTMEEQLDRIATKEPLDASTTWHHLCRECHAEIKSLSKPLANLSKQTYPIDGEYELMFTQYGASLRRLVVNGSASEYEYKSVRKDISIDLERAKRGEYTLAELVEIPDDHLGVWEGNNVILKTGKFGGYIECGDKRISVKSISKPLGEISLEDVMPLLQPDPSDPLPIPTGKNVLRVLTPELSVRRGRFGAYLFYQRRDMSKPAFYPMKGFREGFAVCNKETLLEWARTTHKIAV